MSKSNHLIKITGFIFLQYDPSTAKISRQRDDKPSVEEKNSIDPISQHNLPIIFFEDPTSDR